MLPVSSGAKPSLRCGKSSGCKRPTAALRFLAHAKSIHDRAGVVVLNVRCEIRSGKRRACGGHPPSCRATNGLERATEQLDIDIRSTRVVLRVEEGRVAVKEHALLREESLAQRGERRAEGGAVCALRNLRSAGEGAAWRKDDGCIFRRPSATHSNVVGALSIEARIGDGRRQKSRRGLNCSPKLPERHLAVRAF